LFPGAKPPKREFANPPLVSALCPEGTGGQVQLEIAPSTIKKLIEGKRRTDLFQMWAHLVGEMPPVNNAKLVQIAEHSDEPIIALADAHACFKGVKRRYDQDEDGREIYIYVISTPYTVRWQSSMRTTVGIFPSTGGTVLTVQVKPRQALHGCQEGIWGAIVKWEFVHACRERTDLPDGYGERYEASVWHR
jgi:hypothetical protein